MVAAQGHLGVADAATALGVSEMTIRRDFVILEGQGVVTRMHGGVLAVRHEGEPIDTTEPAFEQRRRSHAGSKAAIAATAARLVEPRQTIGLDVGTTALALAERLAQRSDIRVFTNNLRAAMCLAPSRCAVYLLGGQVRDPELSVIGTSALEQLSAYYLDLVFIGVSGLTVDGFYDYSPEDSEVKRMLIARAGRVIALCDSSKFDRRSLVRVCELRAVGLIVTDAPPPPHLQAALHQAEASWIVASGE